MVRHEGGAPRNNVIKDAPYRATVFVGPTLMLLFIFFFREIYKLLYEDTIAQW